MLKKGSCNNGSFMEKLFKSDRGNRGDNLAEYLRTIKNSPRFKKVALRQKNEPVDSRLISFTSGKGMSTTLYPSSLMMKSVEYLKKLKKEHAGIWHPLEGSTRLDNDSYYGTLLTKNATLDKLETVPTPDKELSPTNEYGLEKQKLIKDQKDGVVTAETICYKMKRIWEMIKHPEYPLPPESWIQETANSLNDSTEQYKEIPIYEEILKFLFPKQMPLLFYNQTAKTAMPQFDANQKGHNDILTGKYTEAIRHFKKRLDRHPLDLGANIGTSIAFFLQGDFEAAYKQVSFILQYYPKNANLLYDKSMCELSMKKYDSAITTATRALIIINSENFNSAKIALPSCVSDLYKVRSIAYFQLGYLTLSSKDYLLWYKCKALKGFMGIKGVPNKTKLSTKLGVFTRFHLGLSPTIASNVISFEDLFIPTNNESRIKLDQKKVLRPFGIRTFKQSKTVSQLFKQYRPIHTSSGKSQYTSSSNIPPLTPARNTVCFSRKDEDRLLSLSGGSIQETGENPAKVSVLPMNKEAKEIRVENAPARKDTVMSIDCDKTERSLEENDNKLSDILCLDDSFGHIGTADLTRNKEKEMIEENRKYESLITALDELKKKVAEGIDGDVPLNAKALKMSLRGKGTGETTLEPGDVVIIRDDMAKKDHTALKTVDKLVQSMFFMRKFGNEERLKLLAQGFYTTFPQGHAIFHQGDLGDYMYIILKGSVGVRITDTAFGAEPLFVATLREGEHFGELALLANKGDKAKAKLGVNRRRASCVCMEESHLLGFPTDVVNEVVLELLNTKLKDDIEFLQNVDYFSDMQEAEIFPLLGNMKKMQYSFGEYIIREGEIPKGMYVIKNGQCMVSIESIGVRSVKKLPCSKNEPKKLFEPGTIQTEDSTVSKKTLRGFNNNILYNSDKNQQLANRVVYHNLIPLETLYKYQTFGEHVLLPTSHVLERGIEGMKIDTRPALFTVTAESACVEVYLVTKEVLEFLTKPQRAQMYQKMGAKVDPIRSMSEAQAKTLKQKYANWENYKIMTSESTIRTQYIKKSNQGWKLRQEI